MRFMTEAAERAFAGAIQAIEQVSSAEVVIAVRPRLRRWLAPHVVLGAAATFAALAYTLYSDAEFDLWSILLLPLLAGLAGGLVVEAIAPLERVVVLPAVREAIVREAARAAFYDLGAHGTKGRTGVVVLVAVRERRVVLLGDVAVVERLGAPGLDRRAAVLEAEVARGGEAVAAALAKLAPDFAAVLPRSEHDVNELADMVQTRAPAHRRLRGRAS